MGRNKQKGSWQLSNKKKRGGEKKKCLPECIGKVIFFSLGCQLHFCLFLPTTWFCHRVTSQDMTEKKVWFFLGGGGRTYDICSTKSYSKILSILSYIYISLYNIVQVTILDIEHNKDIKTAHNLYLILNQCMKIVLFIFNWSIANHYYSWLVFLFIFNFYLQWKATRLKRKYKWKLSIKMVLLVFKFTTFLLITTQLSQMRSSLCDIVC